MRLFLVTVCLAAVTSASATAAPSIRIASHCSASGDVCYGIFRDRAGVTRFQLTLAAKYFTRYRVCVKPPTGATTCKSFPVKRVGSQFGGAVIWDRNFPSRGPGRYRVTWRLGAQALGPGLSFVPPTRI